MDGGLEFLLKKWLTSILLILAFLGAGGDLIAKEGHNQKSYDQAMALGRRNLENRSYVQALTNFRRSLSINSRALKAQRVLNQTQAFVDGKRNLSLQRLKLAKDGFDRSLLTSGNSRVLRRRSVLQINRINQIQISSAKLARVYNAAVDANHHGNYQKSNGLLRPVFLNAKYRKPFLNKTMNQVKALKSSNQALIKARKRISHS